MLRLIIEISNDCCRFRVVGWIVEWVVEWIVEWVVDVGMRSHIIEGFKDIYIHAVAIELHDMYLV